MDIQSFIVTLAFIGAMIATLRHVYRRLRNNTIRENDTRKSPAVKGNCNGLNCHDCH